jgi:hypothetical protein
MSSNFLLDDKFTVTAINKDGKYYEKGCQEKKKINLNKNF